MSFAALAVGMLLQASPWLVTDEVRLAELSEGIGQAATSPRDVADLVGVGYYESGKSWEWERTGDQGHSVTVWQLWACPGEHCLPALVDVEYAARETLARLHASERRCRRLTDGNQWSEFTTGRCQTNAEARVRYRKARWVERKVHGEEDADDSLSRMARPDVHPMFSLNRRKEKAAQRIRLCQDALMQCDPRNALPLLKAMVERGFLTLAEANRLCREANAPDDLPEGIQRALPSRIG